LINRLKTLTTAQADWPEEPHSDANTNRPVNAVSASNFIFEDAKRLLIKDALDAYSERVMGSQQVDDGNNSVARTQADTKHGGR
jgi:hypothetical protein